MRTFITVTGISAALGLVIGCGATHRPSEAEVRQCVITAKPTNAIPLKVEFGKAITSQGGMVELSIEAPKGTTIYPVRIYIPYASNIIVQTSWVFEDSFGKLKCVAAPGAASITMTDSVKADSKSPFVGTWFLDMAPFAPFSRTVRIAELKSGRFEVYQSVIGRVEGAGPQWAEPEYFQLIDDHIESPMAGTDGVRMFFRASSSGTLAYSQANKGESEQAAGKATHLK